MSSFNRAAWNGERPLVAPLPAVAELGSVVWERAEEDSTLERRGGMVVAVRPDTVTGEKVVTILTGRSKHGRRVCNTFDLAASALDPSLTEPRNAPKLHRAVREICEHVGAAKNAYVRGFDRTLIEYAVGLLVLADDMAHEASLAAAKAREGAA